MSKILLVDDEERLLRNLTYFFEDEGYEVFTASSGEEALEILHQETIEVAVVDMRLPGMDGNEVIRQAKAANLLHKFIIHTGSTDYRLPDDLQALGLDEKHVFLKPLTEMAILSKAIKDLLHGKLC